MFQLFATGVNDTGGKFAAGVVDTGGNLPSASLAPTANLPPVSTTQGEMVAKFAAGVVDTGGKFAAGVVDTGGNLPPVLLTPRQLGSEPVFVNLSIEPRNRFSAWRAGTTTLYIRRTDPPGYLGWRNRFLGIDCWAP